MNTAVKKSKTYPSITHVSVGNSKITVNLSDGREVSAPLNWFPNLLKATSVQRLDFTISPGGYGLHWPEIDEDISIKAFLE